MMKRFLLSCLLLLAAFQVEAANRYICQTGQGLQDGSSAANCYNGYAAAWTAALIAPGDTVYLVGNINSATNTIGASGTAGNPITFDCLPYGQASKGVMTTTSGAAPVWIADDKEYITVQNCVFRGNRANETQTYALRFVTRSATRTGIIVQDTDMANEFATSAVVHPCLGLDTDNVATHRFVNVTVRRNQFHECGIGAPAQNSDGATLNAVTSGLVVQDNIAWGNNTDGLDIPGGGAIVVERNLLYNNGFDGIKIHCGSTAISGGRITGNISFGNLAYAYTMQDFATSIVANNIGIVRTTTMTPFGGGNPSLNAVILQNPNSGTCTQTGNTFANNHFESPYVNGVVRVATDSKATFTAGNTWNGNNLKNTGTGSTVIDFTTDSGNNVNVSNFSTWQATHNKDTSITPPFSGGASPTTLSGFTLPTVSAFRNAGVSVGTYTDFGGGRNFDATPSIGAFENKFLHVCPSKSATNGTLTYGTGTGLTQGNCLAGATAMNTAVAAGDSVAVHGTWYGHEKFNINDSGLALVPLVYDFSDALFWPTLDVSADNTIASTALQTNGHSWALVAGTTNVWKKAVSSYAYQMWVDGKPVAYTPTVPAAQTDAGAIAAFTQDNQFTRTSEAYETFTGTMYYRGALSSDMRVNATGSSDSQLANNFGCVVIHDQNYVTLNKLRLKGCYLFSGEGGALFIQGTTGVTVNNPKLTYNQIGLKAQANTNLTVQSTTKNTADCEIGNSVNVGVSVAGQYELFGGSGSDVVKQVTAIAKGTSTRLDFTKAGSDVLNIGERLVFTGVQGMTQINDPAFTDPNELVVLGSPAPTATTFSVTTPDNSAYGAYTTAGRIFVQRTDTGTTVKNCWIHHNGNYPRYNGIDISWAIDADGFGVGYFGSLAINNLTVDGNVIENNGPRRVALAGEIGSIVRGSGMYVGTAYQQLLTNFVFKNNRLAGNHRYNLSIEDTISDYAYNNVFDGTVNYGSTSFLSQLRYGGLPTTSAHWAVNNIFTGESGTSALQMPNSTAATKTFMAANNIFKDLVWNPGTTPNVWDGAVYLTSTQLSVTEGNNDFHNIPGAPYKRSSTQYVNSAAFNAVDSTRLGLNDQFVDPKFVSYRPGALSDYHLKPNSPLHNKGGCYFTTGCAFPDTNGSKVEIPPDMGIYQVYGNQ